MAADFASLLSADMVLVGAEGESNFFVHKDVLALHSRPFRETITANAPYLLINLQDWDHATVARMVEFLYRGMYYYPDPVAINGAPGNGAQGVENAAARPESLTGVPRGNIVDDRKRLSKFTPALYDYREPLISHANVYQLAQAGEIYPLRKLALRHLLDTLQGISPIGPAPCHHTVVAICHLVRNIYANTAHVPIDPPEHQEEGLASHVIKFIAHNFAALRSNSAMVQLLSEGGKIVIDVMEILSNGPPIALSSVPLPVAAWSPPALRSGPVPRVVLPPLASPHAALYSVVLSSNPVPPVAARHAASRSVVLSSIPVPPVASRPVALPSVPVGIIQPVQNRYVCQLVVSDSPTSCPKFEDQSYHRVVALNGESADLGVGDNHVWLYVGYTNDPESACTSFTAGVGSVSAGAVPIRPTRSIVPRRDSFVKKKIIRIALVRVRRFKPIIKISNSLGGVYDGMTTDLYSGADHVYLVWTSVLVDTKKV